MALSNARLKATIKEKIRINFGDIGNQTRLTPEQRHDLFAQAIADAVVEHIQGNLEVTTEVTGGSSAGTYPGVIS